MEGDRDGGSPKVAAPRQVRGILKTAASIWAKKEAGRAALLESISLELVFKVLVLGGDGTGKTALIRSLAGERAAGALPSLQHESTEGVETTTMLAATFRNVPIFLQFWELPLAVLQSCSSKGSSSSGGRRDSKRAPQLSKLHIDIAFSGVHAVLLAIDGSSQGDSGISSLEAADTLRDEIAARLERKKPGSGAFPLFLVVNKCSPQLLRASLYGSDALSPAAGASHHHHHHHYARMTRAPAAEPTKSNSNSSGVATAPLYDSEWRLQDGLDDGYGGGDASESGAGPLMISARKLAASGSPSSPALSGKNDGASNSSASNGLASSLKRQGSFFSSSPSGGSSSSPAQAGRKASSPAVSAAGDSADAQRPLSLTSLGPIVGGLDAADLSAYAGAAGYFEGRPWYTAAIVNESSGGSNSSKASSKQDSASASNAAASSPKTAAAAIMLAAASRERLLSALVDGALEYWGYTAAAAASTAGSGASVSPSASATVDGSSFDPLPPQLRRLFPCATLPRIPKRLLKAIAPPSPLQQQPPPSGDGVGGGCAQVAVAATGEKKDAPSLAADGAQNLYSPVGGPDTQQPGGAEVEEGDWPCY